MGNEILKEVPYIPKNRTNNVYAINLPNTESEYETNITDGNELYKKSIIETEKVSDNNFAQNELVDISKNGLMFQTIKAIPSTVADYAKKTIVGGLLTGSEILGDIAIEAETIKEKGLKKEVVDTASQIGSYYKNYGSKELARKTIFNNIPKIIESIMPNISELKDEKYIPNENDIDYKEKKNYYAELNVEYASKFNKRADSIISKLGLTKTEKDGLAFDISSFATSSFMSLAGMLVLRDYKLVAGMYGLMQKADTTMEQMSRGNTPEESLRIGNINAGFTTITELYGISLLKKWFLSPEIKKVAQQAYQESLKSYLKQTTIGLLGKTAVEEGITGAIQEFGNIYSGNWLGKGNDQTFIENLAQIGQAGAMEAVGGIIGGSPFAIHFAIKKSAFKLGATEEQAQDVADNLAPVVGDQANYMVETFVNEATKNITPEEESKIAQQLTEGLESIKQTQEGTVQQEEENPLIVEARKYKSADEFVNTRPSYFHSTELKNVDLIERQGFKAKVGERSLSSKGDMSSGVFLYDDIYPANEFGKNFTRQGKNPSVIEIKVNGRVYDANTQTQYGWEDNLQTQEIASSPKIISQLKRDGYVGVTSTELGTNATFIFEPSSLKTKSQLTDIWTKSQKQNPNIQEEEIPAVIKGALFAKTQNQEQSDKMAEVLQSTNELHEQLSGIEKENLTDKELVSIQTSDFEQLDYLNNILNTEQTQEQIINNASNLFLQTVLKARETEVGKRAEITNEIDLFIGKPTDNQYSQEQKAKLQEAFYNYLITGKAKSTSQSNLFDLMKSQLNKTYFNLSEKNMLDEKTEIAYNNLIKEMNPKLDKMELTEQLANDLKDEIKNLRKGKPTNLKNVKIIKNLLDFGKSFYNKNASDEDIQLFQNYAEFYRKVFNDLGNLQGVKNIVNQLEEKGLFTFDETKYNSLLDILIKAERKIKEVIRQDIKDMKNKFDIGLGTLNTMLNKLEDIGIKSKNLNDYVLEINPESATNQELVDGINQIEYAFSQAKSLLSQKYISSEYYKMSKKDFEKPIINFGNIKTKIQTTLAKFISGANFQTLQENINDNSLSTVNNILKELKGFEPEIENKIKNTLLKAKTVNDIYDGIDKILFDIETKLNKDYVKKVSKKIKSQISNLEEKAKNGYLQLEDNIFINNLFNFGKNFNKKIDDKIAIELENQDSIYTIAKKDVAEIESQIAEGNLSVEDLSQIKSDLIMQKRLVNSLESDLIDELIYTDTKVQQFTENAGKPFEANERQKLVANAYLKYIYNNKVNNKEEVDNLYQLYKTLDKFSNEVIAEENVRLEAEQKEIMDRKNKMMEHLKKVKSPLGFNQFLKGIADLSNFLEAVLGKDACEKFDTTIAEIKARIMADNAKKSIHQYIKKITGEDYYTYTIPLMRSKPFSESKNKILKELNMNKAEALYYFILSQNSKGLTAVLNTVERDGLMEIESVLSDEDKQIGLGLSSILVDMYPAINEAFTEIHGIPLGKEEVFFSLVYQFDTKVDTIESMNDNESLFSTKLNKEPSWTFNRVKNERKLAKVNPFILFNKYVEDASMFTHVSPILNKLANVLNAKGVANDLKSVMLKKFGDKSYDVLTNLIENINGTVKNNNLGWLTGSKFMNFMVNNMITARVMGKAFNASKQIASLSLFADVVPPKEFAKHTNYAFSHLFEIRNEMFKKHPSLKVRFESIINDRIVDQVLAIDQKSATLENAKNLSSLMVRFVDSVSVTVGSYAYEKHLESLKKYTPQQIDDMINIQVEKSQQSSLKSSQGLYQFETRNALTKGFMAYRSAQLQYFRKAMMTIYRYKNGDITRAEATKTLAIYLIVNPLIFGIMSMPSTAIMFLMDPADDDNKEEIYKLLVRPILNQILSAHYITDIVGSVVFDNIADLVGQKTYKTGAGEALLFSDVIKACKELNKSIKGNVDDGEGFASFTKILTGLQPLTAIPITPAMRMVEGTFNTLEGNFVEGVMNILSVPKSEMEKWGID